MARARPRVKSQNLFIRNIKRLTMTSGRAVDPKSSSEFTYHVQGEKEADDFLSFIKSVYTVERCRFSSQAEPVLFSSLNAHRSAKTVSGTIVKTVPVAYEKNGENRWQLRGSKLELILRVFDH